MSKSRGEDVAKMRRTNKFCVVVLLVIELPPPPPLFCCEASTSGQHVKIGPASPHPCTVMKHMHMHISK